MEVDLKTMRGRGDQKPPHTFPESMSGIIIDQTNKFTVVENWLFGRDDLPPNPSAPKTAWTTANFAAILVLLAGLPEGTASNGSMAHFRAWLMR
jgi:hypothetical protein